MDIFWTFYLNHLSPLWGYFYTCVSFCSRGWGGWLPCRSHDQGESASGGGLCLQEGLYPGRGLGRSPSRYYRIQAGGMHPTGIHSCRKIMVLSPMKCDILYYHHWRIQVSQTGGRGCLTNLIGRGSPQQAIKLHGCNTLILHKKD